MKTIWKYELSSNRPVVAMPRNAVILDVQMQHGEFQIWVLVSPEAPKVDRHFRVYATGQDILDDEPLEHIATVQIGGVGSLVVVAHIFEVLGDPRLDNSGG